VMGDEYTPTTEHLAHAIGEWAYRVGHPQNGDFPEMLADDGETMLARFLEAHDREVAEKAWDEGFADGFNSDDYKMTNPYREGASE